MVIFLIKHKDTLANYFVQISYKLYLYKLKQ